MRLSKAEVARRKTAVLAYFKTNPTHSVAKMNAALTSGAITGKPEKMLNIATGYAWRKEAVAQGVQPPVDNDHVAPGCEPFTPEVIAANQGDRS